MTLVQSHNLTPLFCRYLWKDGPDSAAFRSSEVNTSAAISVGLSFEQLAS